jgi:hypothetical protein
MKMKKTTILINSGDRCGIDTTAELMKARLGEMGKSVKILSFAEPLKNDVADLIGITIEELDNLKNNSEEITIGKRTMVTRDFILDYAKRIKKLAGDNYFVKEVVRKIVTSEEDIIIIPDLRFKVEYEYFNNSENVFFIKLLSDLKSCNVNNEVADLYYDYEFENKEGSIETLKFSIENFITEELMDA